MGMNYKIFAALILIVLIVVTIMPTVQAVTENVLQNATKEEILYQGNNNNVSSTDNNNIINNNNVNEGNIQSDLENTFEEKDSNASNKKSVTSFDVLIANILTKKTATPFKIKDVNSIISQEPSKNGIWVEESSRETLIKIINDLTNKNFIFNDEGYLIEDKENSNKQLNKIYNENTRMIQELINFDKIIMISIQDKYKKLNEQGNKIEEVELSDDSFSVIMKDTDEVKRPKTDVILLNESKYTKENIKSSSQILLDEILKKYEDLYSKNQDNIKTEDDNTVDEKITKTNVFDDRITTKEWNLLFAGILNNNENVTKDNINSILDNRPNDTGIWVSENSRSMFINFINQYTIYTYYINTKGYLVCDNIMKDNPNLDIIEKSETDVDKVINAILKNNKMLIIDLSNNYLKYNQNKEIISEQLENEKFTLSFSNNDNRILLLNKNFYNTTEYDLALSDYMLKAMQNIQSKVLSGEISISKDKPLARSSRNIIGYSAASQSVYAGPDGGNYAKMGSVVANEKVYILGTNAGWYHVQYVITGTNNGDGVELEKAGYIPIGSLSSIEGIPTEESFTGGQGYAQQGLDVQSCDDFDISTKIGSIYSEEGTTILFDYGYSDWTGKSYRVAFIEFSTSSGTKRGYVYNEQLDNTEYATSVARVISTSSAYAGPDTGYVKLGGAYYNEYAIILARSDDWVFTEYNTASGRKRGYMNYYCLEICNEKTYNQFASNNGLNRATMGLTVYGGPNSNNANIGSIDNQEIVSFYGAERGYAYIEYNTLNGAKRGYVLDNALEWAYAPDLPTINTYYGFMPIRYGTSGLGKPLTAYKIGSGPNVAFAVFEQHGWEDAWAFDGIELVKTADKVMQDLSGSGISGNWSLYIIPDANPDGITDGYTNNGPGRCAVQSKVDMNRCWPSNFVAVTNKSRNYTGTEPLLAEEANALKNFIQSRIGNQKKIIIDVHGWYNETYGDATIAQYFANEFGFASHSTSYGTGYLETWGKSIGAQSCLVELPQPSSSQDVINRNYSGKIANALRNMLNNNGAPTIGGETVNEQVYVTANPSLNVREQPGTSYSIITTLNYCQEVTRTIRNASSNNGYTWDQIKLSDGRLGYVATNYLSNVKFEVVSDENGVVYKRNLSQDNIKRNASALDGMLKGEEESGSMTLLYYLMGNGADVLNGIRTLAIGCSEVARGSIPNSADGLEFFLTKGSMGNTLGYIYNTSYPYSNGHMQRTYYFNPAITASSQVNGTFNTALNAAIDATEKFSFSSNQNVSFANKEELALAVEDNSDWKNLLHWFRYNTICNASKTGNTYQMTVDFNTIDYYDWAEDDPLKFLTQIGLVAQAKGAGLEVLAGVLRDMHILGIARNYTNVSTTKVTVSWQQGQRLSTGATYTINN